VIAAAARLCDVIPSSEVGEDAQCLAGRIGVLMSGTYDPQGQGLVTALRQSLNELGWIDGQNVRLDIRWGGGKDSQITAYAAELATAPLDIIVATGTQVTSALHLRTHATPIVFVNVADPIESGFVSSLSRPAGDMTGFTAWEFSIGEKWLELLKIIDQSVSRTMVLVNPQNPTWKGHVRTIEAAAPFLQMEISAVHVHSSDEIRNAIQSFASEPAGGMIVLPSGLMSANRDLLAIVAAQNRLPAIYPYGYFTASGGLLSYGTDTLDLYRRSAVYVDRILRGAKPADLPVQRPTKFELVINLKTAKTLGLEVPATLLARADEVIE